MKTPLPLFWCIFIPALPLVIGIGIFALCIYRFIGAVGEPTDKTLFPGSATFELEKPGKYNLWLYEYTMLDGKVYRSNGKLPAGTEITLKNADTGTGLELHSGLPEHRSSGKEESVSLGKFEILAPATLELQVSGRGKDKPFVLAVRPANFGKIFLIMSAGMLSLFVGIGLAVVLAVIIGIRRGRQPPPPM